MTLPRLPDGFRPAADEARPGERLVTYLCSAGTRVVELPSGDVIAFRDATGGYCAFRHEVADVAEPREGEQLVGRWPGPGSVRVVELGMGTVAVYRRSRS